MVLLAISRIAEMGGIKPYVDFAEAWDTRGSASESKSPHWILLQLWLRQRRNRCLDEIGQIIPVIYIADVEIVLHAVAISAPVPHHLFHGNLPGAGALVNDELYKVRIASHIVRVSEDKFKN